MKQKLEFNCFDDVSPKSPPPPPLVIMNDVMHNIVIKFGPRFWQTQTLCYNTKQILDGNNNKDNLMKQKSGVTTTDCMQL